MALMKIDGAQVDYNLTDKEADELQQELTGEIAWDLAAQMKEDPDFIDEVPQQLAD